MSKLSGLAVSLVTITIPVAKHCDLALMYMTVIQWQLGVAAHEVGHAIQHAQAYGFLSFRSAWVPVANLGSGLSFIVIFIALMMGGAQTATGASLSWLGVLLFGCTTIFTLVTLPVEFDASKRALACLRKGNYVAEKELDGARKVLNAAAMTYVAAFASSLLMLLYYAFRLGLIGGRRN